MGKTAARGDTPARRSEKMGRVGRPALDLGQWRALINATTKERGAHGSGETSARGHGRSPGSVDGGGIHAHRTPLATRPGSQQCVSSGGVSAGRRPQQCQRAHVENSRSRRYACSSSSRSIRGFAKPAAHAYRAVHTNGLSQARKSRRQSQLSGCDGMHVRTVQCASCDSMGVAASSAAEANHGERLMRAPAFAISSSVI